MHAHIENELRLTENFSQHVALAEDSIRLATEENLSLTLETVVTGLSEFTLSAGHCLHGPLV